MLQPDSGHVKRIVAGIPESGKPPDFGAIYSGVANVKITEAIRLELNEARRYFNSDAGLAGAMQVSEKTATAWRKTPGRMANEQNLTEALVRLRRRVKEIEKDTDRAKNDDTIDDVAQKLREVPSERAGNALQEAHVQRAGHPPAGHKESGSMHERIIRLGTFGDRLTDTQFELLTEQVASWLLKLPKRGRASPQPAAGSSVQRPRRK
jgi:hypothetical protein